MWLLKSPNDNEGNCCGHNFLNGYGLVSKQYWYKFFIDRKFKDVTPESLKDIKPTNPKRALFIRWGGYGDILMATPIFKALKEKYPDIEIVLTGMDEHMDILKHNKYVDKYLMCPAHQIGNLVEGFDIAVDFSGIIPANIDAETSNAYDLHFKWVGLNPDDYTPEQKRPIINLIEEDNIQINKWLKFNGLSDQNELIVVCFESTTGIRNFDYEKSREIIIKLANRYPDKKFICIGSGTKIRYHKRVVCENCKYENEVSISGKIKSDIIYTCKGNECGNEIIIKSPLSETSSANQEVLWHVFPDNVIFTQFGIRDFASLVKISKLVISVDSAPLHIAGALETPCFGIFSSFIADYRMRYFKDAYWLQYEYQCSPCFLHHIDCPQASKAGHDKAMCMNSMSNDMILNKIDAIFKGHLSKDLMKNETMNYTNNEHICPVCLMRKNEAVCRKGKFIHYQCDECGAVFVDPKPSFDYLNQHYNGGMYNDIYERLSGVKEFARVLTTSFAADYKFQGRLLEIGCNLGWFLEEAQRLGWDVSGCDISEDSVKNTQKKGIKNVVLGNFEDDRVKIELTKLGKFDVVVIHNTIEHFIDPVNMIKTVKDLYLNNKGIISIITPDVDKWNSDNKWGHINTHFAGEHTTLFNKKAFEIVAERSQLKLLQTLNMPGSDDMWVILQRIDEVVNG